MATDFWASSHYKRWIIDRTTIRQARVLDLQYVDDEQSLAYFSIFFANVISKLGKKLRLRQRVIATATVFFKRFYLKSSYCETDPFIVAAACCYVAGKAEESPVHIKTVVSEARQLFNHEGYQTKNFPSENWKLAEMEFYLVDDLECDLTIFHPYRTLLALCSRKRKNSSDDDSSSDSSFTAEIGELGAGVGEEGGVKYWGNKACRIELPEAALQMAWLMINDTYRSDLCLLYPPHIIAIAVLYFTLALHGQQHDGPETQQDHEPRRSSRRISTNSSHLSQAFTTANRAEFLAGLNVSMSLIATVVQEIISLYALWDSYQDDNSPEFGGGSTSTTPAATPAESSFDRSDQDIHVDAVGPAQLVALLGRMREARLADLAHPSNGRPVAINKMLERAQAIG